MKPQTHRQFVAEVRAVAEYRAEHMSELDLVIALSMFQACDQPLKEHLGLKTDWQNFFVVGVKIAIAQYGTLTHKQRKIAEQMVTKGLIHLIILERRDEGRRLLGMTPRA